MRGKGDNRRVYVNELDGELVHTYDMTEADFAAAAGGYDVIGEEQTDSWRTVTVMKRNKNDYMGREKGT